ncbi:hypothetical protein [Cochleicola gelatinilyticus]|uniref:Uncharacterized protein n=1 Tax=Cochleicola gelatinilyticus TaxID=1763537 RepID=A0A167H5F1_9FLAO|nr:hypothetical protein [Cochleicola gelatinilyticus]OAB78234.1 hypothetical protein ULVI_12210 [Cochleicola gelatinilyticus]
MPRSQLHPLSLRTLTLQEPISYVAEIQTKIVSKNKGSFNGMGLKFSLRLLQKKENGTMHIEVKTHKRILLSKKKAPIKKFSKAQQIALQVAAINDHLIFEVSKNYGIQRLVNTKRVQESWGEIRTELRSEYPDIEEMISDFDWQLQNKYIQHIFLEDNFFNFLFPKLFNHDFKGKQPILIEKAISNGIHTHTIPILAKHTLKKFDTGFTQVTVGTKGELQTEHPKFPLAKLNTFIGSLGIPKGAHCDLNFNYAGSYELDGLKHYITKGQLRFSFEIKEHYLKETSFELFIDPKHRNKISKTTL